MKKHIFQLIFSLGLICLFSCNDRSEFSKKGTYWIYPNPCSTETEIRILNSPLDAQVKLFDTKGKIIFNETFNSQEKTFTVPVFESGVHYFEIRIGKNNYREKLFVLRY